ncbi:MAG: MFS transporter, partial [Candidatus Riflebacteria bacterium]|nr:MFS transporter [Candidatus Riflebacteria bacterium]
RFTDRIGKGLRSSPRDAMIADDTPTETRGTAFGFHRAMDHCGALLGPILAYLLLRHAGVALETVFLWAVLPGALGVLVLGLAVREEPREGVPARRSGEQGLRPTGRFRAYLLLVCLFTLGNSSDSFLILRAHELGMTVALAPILSALLHVVKALASTPGGWLSDRLGRRPLLILGWALYAALYAVVGFTSSLAGLWIVVTVYGLYYGLTEGVQKAWVADLVEPAQRGVAFGWYHTAIGIGALPANVLFGIVWKTWGSAAAFVVAAGFAALAVLGLLLFVTTTPRAPGPSTPD